MSKNRITRRRIRKEKNEQRRWRMKMRKWLGFSGTAGDEAGDEKRYKRRE